MFWLYAYLAGMGLKLVYNLVDEEKRGDSTASFNETVLWPIYLVYDVFGFFVALFG